MDLISVIIPCYNSSKTIKKCIASLKKQNYKNIEVLIIDDGSTDTSSKLIKEVIKNDKRFKYFYKKNGGQASARNMGIKKSTGKYICFVDADDYVLTNFIDELYSSLKKNNSLVSTCFFDRVYSKKIKLNKFGLDVVSLIKFPAVWNKLYDSNFLKNNNIYFINNYWYEDLNFNLKVYINSNDISLVEKSLYKYIINQNSTMHTYNDKIYDIFNILDDDIDYAKSIGKYKENINLFEFAYVYHVLIGTIYRVSFKNDFNKKEIKNILDKVSNIYPNWYSNIYIKQLPNFYKIYLYFLNKKQFNIIYFALKLFNKKINL